MEKQQAPVRKGGVYNIEITGLGHSGEGVGRIDGFTVFVPNGLSGETVKVKVTEVKKTYAKGILQAVLTPSAARVESRCAIYDACGGCQLQHLDYAAQLVVKRQSVVDAIERIAKLPAVLIHPVLGSDEPWHYRNKMQLPVGLAGGKVVAGCYSQGTHEIIPAEYCAIQHETNNTVARIARSLIEKLNIPPYQEKTGQGILRHIIGRTGVKTGESMVVLVTTTDTLPHKEKLIAELCQAIPGLVSIVQNINNKKTNVIMGDKTKTLWGRDTITDYLGEFAFQISARSFFQVNTKQAEVLYNQALRYANLTGKETVIDAYCGTGTIALFLAKQAAQVYGVEIVPQAIADAKSNAQNNNIHNTEFLAGDTTELLPKLYNQGIRPEVIVTDPPRAGCQPEVLKTFADMQPERIVYVSCNPSSLARDLAVLNQYGYIAREIQPVDMFPMTYHVECVALIERG